MCIMSVGCMSCQNTNNQCLQDETVPLQQTNALAALCVYMIICMSSSKHNFAVIAQLDWSQQYSTFCSRSCAHQLCPLQELAEHLADPLVPKFSHRFFTGGAAAAVGAQQGQNPSSQSQSPDADADSPHQAPVVQQAVKYANKVSDSRKAAIAKQASKKAKGKKLHLPASQQKKPVPVSRQVAEDQALQKALNRSRLKKDLRQRNSKLTVIPAAFGREKQGADALRALRSKLGKSAE